MTDQPTTRRARKQPGGLGPTTWRPRIVHSAAATRRRQFDQEVARIEAEILGEVERRRTQLLNEAAAMIAECLAPIDAREARLLLSELRSGTLP